MTFATTNQSAAKRPMAREPKPAANEPPMPSASDVAVSVLAAPGLGKLQTKSALVLDLLQRPGGVTIDQLAAATGWLPHTTRAALTHLKKKGHVIISKKPAAGSRAYYITAKAEAAQ